jgi:dihydrofolate reductase
MGRRLQSRNYRSWEQTCPQCFVGVVAAIRKKFARINQQTRTGWTHTMRKLIVLSFISLDGVMQAPGGPEEDTRGNFKYGGWTVPYFDDFLGQAMGEQMGSRPFDLLLGRKTFELFASYWPQHESPINAATKYVVSNTLTKHAWNKSVFLNGDAVEQIKKLKQQDGPELQVHGSGNLIQTLLKHDLVDEFWLKIFPVTLGGGKRLFAEGTLPAAFKLSDGKVSPSGVIIANFARAGDVKTGSF